WANFWHASAISPRSKSVFASWNSASASGLFVPSARTAVAGSAATAHAHATNAVLFITADRTACAGIVTFAGGSSYPCGGGRLAFWGAPTPHDAALRVDPRRDDRRQIPHRARARTRRDGRRLRSA